MPSSPSPLLRLELQGVLENDNTWGDKANLLFQRLEDAVAGYISITHGDAADKTLTALNYDPDESRNMYVKINGAITAQRNVVCPTSEKLYFVENATSGGFGIVFKTSGGTGITIPNGKKRVVMCDGTNVIDAVSDLPTASTLGGVEIVTLTGTQTLTNKTITIDDNKLTIQDQSDTSKKVNFELTNVVGTRVWTFPNAADTFVGLTATQSPTNKTFDNTTTLTIKDTLLTIQDQTDPSKQVNFELTGVVGTRLWTFPDGAHTFTGLTATQTLSNKTLDNTTTIVAKDSIFTLQDEITPTKQVNFQLSGIVGTRLWTFPDAADTFVGTTATQTLTNKTITIADNALTIQDNATPGKQAQFEASGITNGATRIITIPDSNGTLLYTTGSGASLTGIRKQGKETIWMPANGIKPNTGTGAATPNNRAGTNIVYPTLDFDNVTSQSGFFQIAMPKSWDLGNISFIAYWTAQEGSGDVTFTLQAQAISNDDVIDTAFSGGQSVTDTLIALNDLHISSESTAFTPAGTPAAGDLILFKLLRDIADTLSGDAQLLGIKVLYTTNAADDT